MTLDYTACHFEVTPLQPAADLLIAELGSLGFESFEETSTGVIAYINTAFWRLSLLEGLAVYDYEGFSFSYGLSSHYSGILNFFDIFCIFIIFGNDTDWCSGFPIKYCHLLSFIIGLLVIYMIYIVNCIYC